MKDAICEMNFNSQEEKIRTLFSTQYILNCFCIGNAEQYKEIFQEKSIKNLLSNADAMYSVEQFFKNNLNLSQTSKNSFMHRNTLIYRIRKIKKATGLNIKCFEDAVILSNIIVVYKNIQSL